MSQADDESTGGSEGLPPTPGTPTRDLEISCAHCGDAFLFTRGERVYFAERGLKPPKHCWSCREARREADARRERPDPPQGVPAVCDACGTPTVLPFEPTEERPVYCDVCFRLR